MMHIDENIDELSAYLDGQLSRSEMEAFERRLESDVALRSSLEALQQTVSMVREHGGVRAPAGLLDDILAAVEDETSQPSFVETVREWVARNFTTVSLAAVVVAVLVLLPFVVSEQQPTVSNELEPQVGMVKSTTKQDDAPESPEDDALVAAAEVDSVAEEVVPEPEVSGTANYEKAPAKLPLKKKEKMSLKKAPPAGKGDMFVNGPQMQLGVNPGDLERLAAIYAKYADASDPEVSQKIEALATLKAGVTTRVQLDLPTIEARNGFEREMRKAFPGTYSEKRSPEMNFTLDHAEVTLKVTVASQVPPVGAEAAEQRMMEASPELEQIPAGMGASGGGK